MEEGQANSFYPVALRLSGRRCLIVGGGRVAERKLNGLLEAGADRIVLVSPSATDGIQALASSGRITWERRSYAHGELGGVWLVIAATSEHALNSAIAEEAERLGILSNIADSFGQGSFITPSVIRRGDLIIAVTASGSSPALAKAIKRELEERYGGQYREAVMRLGELRKLTIGRLDDKELKQEVLRLAAEQSLSEEGACGNAELWLESLLEEVKGRSLL